MRKLGLLIFILLGTVSVSFAALTNQENLLRVEVAHLQANQVDFLKKMTEINSGTSNIPGVYKVGEFVRPQFEKLGFKTYWVEEPKSFERAPTLVAEHIGSNKGKRILLIGHLDTVFAKNTAFQNFQVKKNIAKGPGVVDDKGGVAVILYALKALDNAHLLRNATIRIVLTGDEEDSGKPASISRKPLVDAAKKSDVALDFEEAASYDTASIARRGISAWTVTTTGKEAHSSSIFRKEIGAGAIFELARIINTMRLELHEKNVTYNPGLILGGTATDYNPQTSSGKAFGKTNVIAKTAMAKGDFRYLTIEEKQNLERQMEKIVGQHLAGTHADIYFQDGIPAMPATSANLNLLKQYSQVSEDLGQGKIVPLDPNERGAGDISYVAGIVPANLIGLGAMGEQTHSVGETLYLNSLPVQTVRAAILLHRLSNER